MSTSPTAGPDLDGLTPEEANVLRAALDNGWLTEPYHEHDCPGCDIASDVAGTIAASWDPNEQWDEMPALSGVAGDSLLDQLTRIVAWVLHRRICGVKPSLEQLLARARKGVDE